MSKILGGGAPKAAAPAPAPVQIIIPQADTEELEKQRKRDLARRAGSRQASTDMSGGAGGDDTLG